MTWLAVWAVLSIVNAYLWLTLGYWPNLLALGVSLCALAVVLTVAAT